MRVQTESCCPHHHEANGAAAAAVKAMKALVAKTTTTGRINVDEFRSGLTGIPEHATGAWLQSCPTPVWPDASLPAAHSPDCPEAKVARATLRSGQGSNVAHGQGQNPARRTPPAPSQSFPPAQLSVCNTHAPSGGT